MHQPRANRRCKRLLELTIDDTIQAKAVAGSVTRTKAKLIQSRKTRDCATAAKGQGRYTLNTFAVKLDHENTPH